MTVTTRTPRWRVGGNTVAAASPSANTARMTDEQPFLEKYTGQRLDELLGMVGTYRVDSILLAIEQALQRKPASERSAAERIVLAVEALEREVNNGGYDQFFLNEPSHAHAIAAALTEIGCLATARITESAVDVLGVRPGWTDEQIEAAALALQDAQMEKLSALDDEFYEYPDPIEGRLLAYIRDNTSSITL